VPLVGKDLPDVAVGGGQVAGSAGALARFTGPAVKRDRSVPAAVEVGEHAEVVEYIKLVLGVPELGVDRRSQNPSSGTGIPGSRPRLDVAGGS
jgi:hypothetical protein